MDALEGVHFMLMAAESDDDTMCCDEVLGYYADCGEPQDIYLAERENVFFFLCERHFRLDSRFMARHGFKIRRVE